MADHAKPILTSTYTNFVTELDSRFDDLAVGLDPAVTTATNLPTGSIRWNSALYTWQKWDGTAWGELSPAINININGTVGAAVANTGKFTTLSASGAITASGGTANGIAYLNGSKILTTGSALTYDGANMGIGTNSPSSVPGFTTLKINSAATGALLDLAQGNVMRGRFAASAGEFSIETSGSMPIMFAPGGAEALRMDTSRRLLVGGIATPSIATSQSGEFYGDTSFGYVITNTAAANWPLCVWNQATSGSRRLVAFMHGSSATVGGSITTDGTSTSYNTTSDYRLKNVTGPITTSGDYIDRLRPVEGTWKEDGSIFVGLIAHEVQEASRTNVVTGIKDDKDMQSMDYSSAEIIANLIAELQSVRKRLADLEALQSNK